MEGDLVGLNIGGDGDGEAAPTCPDCGNEMQVEFSILTDDEELAKRVLMSYEALKDIPVEDIMRLMDEYHVHIVADSECEEEPPVTK